MHHNNNIIILVASRPTGTALYCTVLLGARLILKKYQQHPLFVAEYQIY
jgi:hypothetical protein